jgi:large subunit ribosomal protein L23
MIENQYNIISQLKLVITEKALRGSAYNSVVYKVPKNITKKKIKNVLESLYKDVKIVKITSLNFKGKKKKFKGKLGKQADYKKIYARFEKPIDVTNQLK